ncbi:hypothetical protein BBO99_00006321 [Phytophthora kernoviae]|uniref:Uncharacterized protein n=2 Tax=Phytophthora kernoviae TaxID=325452 RepID=A0A3R7J5S7_9STRA|nr:hypothetical protein G195_007034 [Phytophthora kernoviae 00238/432]KAG2520573.1 hypothetical protein JM16_006669 [Phytophthora kernoviae]KAG2521668.1 hypothetical protein JM18_005876 [Phytophthora kernoviae]RLN31503.1 hypothetical protein BBI17_006455 [Phytophthora kernoviae]RLN77982.1 hypothetical protein BBO99_00006321 [Phytophthora kernoviae]
MIVWGLVSDVSNEEEQQCVAAGISSSKTVGKRSSMIKMILRLLLEVRDLILEHLARLLVHVEQSVELLVGPGGCGAQFLPDSAHFNGESVDPNALLLVLAA